MLPTGGCSIGFKITGWTSQDLADDDSTLIQVVAWAISQQAGTKLYGTKLYGTKWHH